MQRFSHWLQAVRREPVAPRAVQLAQHIVALAQETTETQRALAAWAQQLERAHPQLADGSAPFTPATPACR